MPPHALPSERPRASFRDSQRVQHHTHVMQSHKLLCRCCGEGLQRVVRTVRVADEKGALLSALFQGADADAPWAQTCMVHNVFVHVLYPPHALGRSCLSLLFCGGTSSRLKSTGQGIYPSLGTVHPAHKAKPTESKSCATRAAFTRAFKSREPNKQSCRRSVTGRCAQTELIAAFHALSLPFRPAT